MASGHELTLGRSIGISFEHGEDLFGGIAEVCRELEVRQGFIPMFIAGLSEVSLAGTCSRVEDLAAPVWESVDLSYVEAHGSGTIAFEPEGGGISTHIHLSVGRRHQAAVGHTSHLLQAKVQFLVEMLLVEVVSPAMRRPLVPELYGVPRLQYTV
ncbi:putative DNA-binding protein with PD1-like motif [Allocatelliglobosispora scoriae]|uniref:Putative DNA-binding protein with PD1-like motif n=1 Tax=Allocatelliglobosispora scoriae TaxID=643052 RepID=A0A841C2A3_9ACTN|nr:DUF296 domain-containing protein [Allocatelliglobosispora scoriae]MBB5872991.1 putative DNA-binding protein with PD1-like motif [Allocatelliglobosispora scoriae]